MATNKSVHFVPPSVCAVSMVATGDNNDSGTDNNSKGDEGNQINWVKDDDDYDVKQGSLDQASLTSDHQPDPPQHGTSTGFCTRKGAQAL
ncbi:hypothetical protein PSHT_12978 [Puccinia striiformis]|uniref:Uncharacterized protein n=2 Tax=Puccinia striiformis TaxID=27350 RepID=A0A2S4UTI4_9BASI|nr:hypothetical protein PSHT_12978 [Puccinia striiformis]POW13062.1 hypothetical protein PSTT_04013 [Puccinia striiformis]